MNLRAMASRMQNVEFLGQVPPLRVKSELAVAAAVVFPSIWYEGLSRVVIEAFSKGTPVIASDLGPIPAIVKDQRTGVIFRTGNSTDLAAKLDAFPPAGPLLRQMRAFARMEYEKSYSDEVVYRDLMSIYQSAVTGVPQVNPL